MTRTGVCLNVLVFALSLTAPTEQVEEATDNVPLAGCGPVPPDEEMMKVLKPMSDVILQCLPVFDKHSVQLSAIFRTVETMCARFDECVPGGLISNRNQSNPQLVCLKECIVSSLADMPTNVRDIAGEDFYKCLTSTCPLKKKNFLAVMHWFLLMTAF